MAIILDAGLNAILDMLQAGHMTVQHPFDCCGVYGSSLLSTVPHSDGTMKSRVELQYSIRLIEASNIVIRGRSRSSLRRSFSSFSRLSFRSARLCFLLLPSTRARISYDVGILCRTRQSDRRGSDRRRGFECVDPGRPLRRKS